MAAVSMFSLLSPSPFDRSLREPIQLKNLAPKFDSARFTVSKTRCVDRNSSAPRIMPVGIITDPNFEPTRWSRVVRLRDASSSSAKQKALAEFVSAYWFPLYAHVRRCGYQPQDAEDLTQTFLGKAIEKQLFENADAEKGKLRTFLLKALQRFIKDEKVKSFAEKRGGKNFILSWDELKAEDRYQGEPIENCTAEDAFNRQWITQLIEKAQQKLAKEYSASGKESEYEVLQPFIDATAEDLDYDAAATKLGMPLSTFRVTLFRFRTKHRRLIREEIRQTLDDPSDEELDREIKELMGVLR